MANAYAPLPGRSILSTPDTGASATLDRLRAAWKRRQAYRRTLAELGDLPHRALRDLDLEGEDLAAIARRAVYGH